MLEEPTHGIDTDVMAVMSSRPAIDPHWRRDLGLAICLFLLALCIRLPLLGESLWLDEMTTYRNYVSAPIIQTVAGGHGNKYVPNNHTLHSLLARASLHLTRALHFVPGARPTGNPPPKAVIGPGVESFTEAGLRMPAAIAGSLVGIALAWPVRRSHPGAALLMAVILAVQPWLIAFSTEARGYTLVLLLMTLATHLLPDRARRVAWGYAAAIALALYTVPICATVVAAHGAVMLLLRRELFRTWARSAFVGFVFAAVLYAPLFESMLVYYRKPYEPTTVYARFLRQLPQQLFLGRSIGNDLATSCIPLVILLVGGTLAWKQKLLRPALLTFAIACGLGVIAPLFIKSAGEVRFMPWLILLYAIALTAIFMELWRGPALRVVASVLLVLFVVHAGRQFWRLKEAPNQPVREGIDLLGKIAPPDAPVVVLSIGAREIIFTYGNMTPQPLAVVHTVEEWQKKEDETPGSRWAVVAFEGYVQMHDPEVWDYLESHYTLRRSLPGRISKVDLYERTR